MNLHQIDIVTDISAQGQRIDLWLSQKYPDISRRKIQEALKNGQCHIDHNPTSKAGHKLKPNQHITGQIPLDEPHFDAPQDLGLTPVYEDEHLMVMNKPAGMVTHPGHGNKDGTCLNGILHLSPNNDALPKSGLIHRLDKDTSGLLICAKTLSAYLKLNEMMQNRQISRIYDAFCWSLPYPTEGTIDAPIGRCPTHRTRMAIVASGKRAVTHYALKQYFSAASLIECRLDTGRTHQIRVHMASIGCPVIGDPVYKGTSWRYKGSQDIKHILAYSQNMHRQALHARELSFTHPITHEQLTFNAPWPLELEQLHQLLSQL